MKIFFRISLLLLAINLLSCKKDKDPEPEPEPATPVEKGNLDISFDNRVDTVPLVFNQKYTNPNGDTFQVSKFNYIISNIVLTSIDNSTFAEPISYHIIRHSNPGSATVKLTGVPAGSYKSIRFTLGVDSATSASGAKTGELDLSKSSDMYWDWSTGYIALKLEGISPQSGSAGKAITFHTGGYGGVNKSQRDYDLSFKGLANVTQSLKPLVRFSVNVNELFKSPNLIKFATQYYQMTPGPGVKVFADNYSNMITFAQIQN